MVFQIPMWIWYVLAGIGVFSILQLIFGGQPPPPSIDYNILILAGLIGLILYLLLK